MGFFENVDLIDLRGFIIWFGQYLIRHYACRFENQNDVVANDQFC